MEFTTSSKALVQPKKGAHAGWIDQTVGDLEVHCHVDRIKYSIIEVTRSVREEGRIPYHAAIDIESRL